MNCDRLAPYYRSLEAIAFGSALQRHRVRYLNLAKGRQRALIVGDGDGRFAQALQVAYPSLAFDSIELSSGMINEARKRQVDHTQADARVFPFQDSTYDIAFTHFFLDCFSGDELTRLVARIGRALRGNAVWIISDFRKEQAGWRRVWTQSWLKMMYLFFAWFTGLQTVQLPDYESALTSIGFTKCAETLSSGGLIASQVWHQRSSG